MHRAGKQVITPAGASPWTAAPRIDNALLQAIVRAHRWRDLLEGEKHASAADLAKAEKVNDSYLSRILRITLLAPDILETILDGRQPKGLELRALMSPLPLDWDSQRNLLGFAEAAGGGQMGGSEEMVGRAIR
jgi:hypothetical protein